MLETTEVTLTELSPHPQNVRQGDIGAIAESLKEHGQYRPIVVQRSTGYILAGNHTYQAAKQLKHKTIAVTYMDCDDDQALRILLVDNRANDLANYDDYGLTELLTGLMETDRKLIGTGFTPDDLDQLLADLNQPPLLPEVTGDPDEVPETIIAKTVPGDVWILGEHRLMCGDSTSPTDLAKLMTSDTANLIHADPPYGMGKEKDGVLNDNLYADKLDAFQLAWWAACRPHTADNGSVYIWGNAPDLWRLWWKAEMWKTETLEIRNEIVWDKKNVPGMSSPGLTQYPEASERCLFIQIGQQFIGNINSDDFPEEWEPLRNYMETEATHAGIGSKDIKDLLGISMWGHWFSRSQFTLCPEKHYTKIQQTYAPHFPRTWKDLKQEWDRVKGNGRTVINGKLEGTRSYFDNAHDNMTDVWSFPRVTGIDRHGHATPKPVAMMERAIKSSTPKAGIVLEPFGGSGSTLIAAHTTGRVARVMELDPHYCDVICARYQTLTGQIPIAEATGNAHNFLTE
jgi:DNA modification methylase